MTNELDIVRVCMLVRPGLEIWLDSSKATAISSDLINNKAGKFIGIEGRLVNVADIAGIFTPEDLQDYRRRERGQWKCKYDAWHSRNETCECGRVH